MFKEPRGTTFLMAINSIAAGKFFSEKIRLTVDSRRISPYMFFRDVLERRICKFASADAFEKEKGQEHDQ